MLLLHSSWCAGKCLATHVSIILVGMKHVVQRGWVCVAQILAHKYHLPKKSESQQKKDREHNKPDGVWCCWCWGKLTKIKPSLLGCGFTPHHQLPQYESMLVVPVWKLKWIHPNQRSWSARIKHYYVGKCRDRGGGGDFIHKHSTDNPKTKSIKTKKSAELAAKNHEI